MPVRMFQSKTLSKAYVLAKLQEITIVAIKEQPKPTTRTPYIPLVSKAFYHHGITTYPQKPPNNTGLLPIPNLPHVNLTNPFVNNKASTNKNFYQKRAKEICFWYDKRYTYGHKCKRKQVFMLQSNDLTKDDFNELEEPKAIWEEQGLMQLSL